MPSAWEVGSAVIEAAATVVVAGFAAIQLRREWARQRQLERAAAARISALGFKLRRQVLAWVGGSDDDFDEWISDAKNNGTFLAELQRAEGYATAMMDLIGDAPKSVGFGVRSTYVHLLEGIRRVQWYARQVAPFSSERIWEIVDTRGHAEDDFRDVARILKEQVIEMLLLNEEASLARLRADDTFDANIGRLARAIIAEEEAKAIAVEPQTPLPPPALPRTPSPRFSIVEWLKGLMT